MNPPVESPHRNPARVVGVAYLFAMATSMFGEAFVRGRLMVLGDAAQTAQNIIANATLFRIGIASEILTFTADIALITALYTILAPVHRPLALFATAIRLAAETSFVMMAADSFDVLRILSGAPYLQAFDGAQLAALARVSLGAHNAAYGVGFVFLGFGSTVFAWLWIKSGYVPRAMGVLGVIGSLLLTAGSFWILMVPGLGAFISPAYMVPLFFFEVGMGLLLVTKGLRTPAAHAGRVHAQVAAAS